ncbi:phage portal protein [Silvimonas sp.]|uniref:phage portal protein n=1 Tax=Silvimonas sp. TaxID=2650811 RepID=UPI00283B02CB|nr:phage portal protein [Silvimonas sp.]MDR3429033.1 phage portal protein [Silvimonas sp.]
MNTHTNHAAITAPTSDPKSNGIEVFTFGDPESVLDNRGLLDYLHCMNAGRWYEPPVNFNELSKTFRITPHHSSPIYVKRNTLVSTFIPHRLMSASTFSRWVLNYLVFGNGYVERTLNRLGEVLSLDAPLAKYVRRGTDLSKYWYVTNVADDFEFAADAIFHLMEPDIDQEVYGLPEYLSGLSAAQLAEAATLFRRKYFKNGSHAGFILYLTDPIHNESDVADLRTALKNSKGPGNFRNLLMYAPNGKKDGVQLIPISEVAAKDDFMGIKNTSRDDQLAAHRVPPQLMGIIPTNTGGFGSPQDAANVFAVNELEPLQARFRELNDWLGEEVVRFRPYALNKQT